MFIVSTYRDDILSCINSSFTSDSPPPLLVAIQFHWSYGAVKLLLHGADPATHWDDKLVYKELHKYCIFSICHSHSVSFY